VLVVKQSPRAPWSGAGGPHPAARIGRYRFAPGLWATAATLLAFLALVALGTWQLERLAWKRDLIATRQAQLAAPAEPLPATASDWRAWDFRVTIVHGGFRHDLEQLFGVAAIDGRVGHHVLTPLVRPDGVAVLIDRGWVPADQTHPAARRAGQLEGPVGIRGIARYRADDRPGWFTPDNRPEQSLWYWYDLGALERTLRLPLLPVVVEADATPNPGGLPLAGRTRTELPNSHLQYAITWYGLAAGLLVIWVSFGLARGRRG
jgi:surfeit locus 1 family protein